MEVYILAGGKSSRMGEDKGLMFFREKPMIMYVLEQVIHITKNIFIVTSNQEYKTFGYPLLQDKTPHLGPAGAIDTLLHNSKSEKNLVIACDMPFIDQQSIHYMIEESKDHKLTIPIYKKHIEALFGIYSTSCKDQWHRLVEENNHKLSILLSHFQTKFVDADIMLQWNPNLFENMNSKDDVNKFDVNK